ncbi:transporter substrate-binding domain-containing protein [Luteolibacter pohnpeiensis]|uniref:Transporter substrate-binding domain-containing protein n=1 Tax=Luteolibacter pohnpeiensis TaxID=454153 RepID=A0A934VRW3_9BACT|nr:transporter substrate-binding domain-containing protein [Luteolibacter pohnpeiensis]MBK1883626.1 transporter substrate-binding domain-containing protein [Luteolibacter pohnpeiensis]
MRLIFALLVLPFLLLGCKREADNTLRVGMELTYPPFETQDSAGNPAGVSVDIAKALAADLGRPLKIVPMEFQGLIPALKTGTIDMVISSMTATDSRRQSIDFSEPYAFTCLALLVAKDSNIQSVEDLKAPGRRIAVKSSTTGESWATEHLPNAKRTAFSDDAACVLEVAQGRADAFIYDQLSILRYHKKNPDTTRAILQPFTEEGWAVGIAKNHPELLSQTNAFLTKFRADGGLEKLVEKYLAQEKAEMESLNLQFPLR